MKAKLAILVSLVCASGAISTLALADETMALSDAPAAVQKTIQAQVADGKVGDITKGAQDEETVYNVDLTGKDGADRDFSVAEDGTLLSVEVALNETPAPVQKTIQTELNGGDLESIDKNLDDSEMSYDVQGTGKDGKDVNFSVAPRGRFLGMDN